jgi:hypothetical protein
MKSRYANTMGGNYYIHTLVVPVMLFAKLAKYFVLLDVYFDGWEQ